jgi:two-component system, LuxR family, response regulator FixJ
MGRFQRIYVVDRDEARRAQLAKLSYDAGIHAEPSESLSEFECSTRQDGIVLCADDTDLELVAQIQQIATTHELCLPTLAYAENPRPDQIVRATMAGALGYLVWPLDEQALRRALEVDEGLVRLSNLRMRQAKAASSIAALSKRERKVLQLMTVGHSNKEIGRILDISHRTVEVHRANLYFKLNLRNATDAVRVGMYAGLDVEENLELA